MDSRRVPRGASNVFTSCGCCMAVVKVLWFSLSANARGDLSDLTRKRCIRENSLNCFYISESSPSQSTRSSALCQSPDSESPCTTRRSHRTGSPTHHGGVESPPARSPCPAEWGSAARSRTSRSSTRPASPRPYNSVHSPSRTARTSAAPAGTACGSRSSG